MGDFNLPNIMWNTREIKKSRSTMEKNCAKCLLDFTDDHLLIQQVHEPTRKDKTILDLIFTNNDESLHNITVEKTNMSDHDIINMTVINSFAPNDDSSQAEDTHSFDKLNFFKANWDNINQDLNQIEWGTLITSQHSVDEAVEILESNLSKILKTHTPIKENKKHGKSRKIPRRRNILIRKCRKINSKNYANKTS